MFNYSLSISHYFNWVSFQCILFVDDLSMPQKETYGAQPPLELIRQWIDHGHWYDLKDSSKQELVDVVSTIFVIYTSENKEGTKNSVSACFLFQLFVSAMLPPGGGSNVITSRLTRHTHIITVDSFEDATLTKIFTSIMDWHFNKGFNENIYRMSKVWCCQ